LVSAIIILFKDGARGEGRREIRRSGDGRKAKGERRREKGHRVKGEGRRAKGDRRWGKWGEEKGEGWLGDG